jgi:hypothetical protein
MVTTHVRFYKKGRYTGIVSACPPRYSLDSAVAHVTVRGVSTSPLQILLVCPNYKIQDGSQSYWLQTGHSNFLFPQEGYAVLFLHRDLLLVQHNLDNHCVLWALC